MSNYKLVIKNDSTSGIHGIQTLNGIPQPLMDIDGNIDMSSNFLKVRNMEVGVEQFTTNGNLGIINTYSDSTNTNISCINFKHTRNNIGGNNRRYCSFDPSNNTNTIAGSITGNSVQVLYNTTSDSRLKNVITNTGTYTSDNITNTVYSTWLGSVNALNPCIYSYKSDIVGENNQLFTYKKTTDGSDISANYQGFLANEVQIVYPPAVTGVSGETMTVNGQEIPVYQQVDMTKLIPMMVGAIKDLSTTVTELTSQISNLTLLSILNPMWNDWTVIKITDSIRLFTTTDTTNGIKTYNNTRYDLEYKAWGVQSSDNKLSFEEKQSYLSYLLSTSSFNYAPVTGLRFIYNISSNNYPPEYSYNYYIATSSSPNVFTDASVNDTTDISNAVAIIYDLDYDTTYNRSIIYSTLSTNGYHFSHTFKVSDTALVWYSSFSNESNSLNTFYTSIQPNLTSTYFGINQYNTTIPDKKTYLQDQITKNGLQFSPVEGYQFIYDYSYESGSGQYTYSYLMIESNNVQDLQYDGTDPSGTIGLIYDTSL